MSDHQETASAPPPLPAPPTALRWFALVLLSLPMLGNYYIYDIINPLADIFTKKLGFTNEMVGWLNASYSVGAFVTLALVGFFIDRFGTKLSIVVFSVLCLAGAIVTALDPSFSTMVAGRVVLGLGAEALIVAVTTALAKWFKGKELSFAFAVNLAAARLGQTAADNSPTWAGSVFYPNGPDADPSWQGPLLLAVGAGVLCVLGAMVYWWLEARTQDRCSLGQAGKVDRLELREVFLFPRGYWLIVGLCLTFYSAIFPFRTFAIKFLMDTHFAGVAENEAREAAGFFNSLLPWTSMVAAPLFGLLVDKVGKRALFMMLGSVLLMPVYLILAYAPVTLWVPMILMGIAFSLIPAVLWPSVAYLVDERKLGTAYALMTFIQQIGLLALPELVGRVNDDFKASAQNPAGYAPGMWIFSVLGFLGFFFAFLLMKAESGSGARGLETIRASGKSSSG